MVGKSLFSSLFAVALAGFAATVSATEKYIVSGARWTDTSGNYINAHGAGMLYDNSSSLWYWVGEYKGSGNGFQGFALYSSSDLINWDSHGLIVDPSSNLPFQVGERPKLIRNPNTGEYVLWFHADPSNYLLAKVGVCTASQVTGPWTCTPQGVFSPLGMQSRDVNVYLDAFDNNQGYLLFATNDNAVTAIAAMDSSYTNVTKLVSTIDTRLEGFGVYNVVLSYQSGWQPNANSIWTTSDLATTAPTFSQYIAPQAYNTYDSQNTFEISPNDNLEVYLGDRWWVTDLSQSTYVWYPLVSRSLVRLPVWKPDASSPTGYSVPANSTFALSKTSTTIKGNTTQAALNPCSACPSGVIAQYVGNGNSFTLHNVSTPNGAAGDVWMSVFYSNQNSYPNWRFGSVQVNSATPLNITYPTGGSPSGVLMDTPVKVSLNAGHNDITFAAPTNDPTQYAADISHVIVWQSDE